jgi:hypothetical protein
VKFSEVVVFALQRGFLFVPGTEKGAANTGISSADCFDLTLAILRLV